MAAEDRIGMVAVVAIPVIEGEAGERLFAVGVLKALADLTYWYDVETGIDPRAQRLQGSLA